MSKPVAWMWTRKYGDGGYIDKVFQFLCDAEEYAKDSQNLERPDSITPLYGSSPPTREPLSYDKIVAIIQSNKLNGLYDLARAIEKAHDIGVYSNE